MQLMTKCYKGESAPHDNAAGPLLAVLLVFFIMAAYQFYFHFSNIKIICTSCFQKERSQSITTFYVKNESFELNMGEPTSSAQTEADIQPKDFPINIFIRDLSLTLKSVSFSNLIAFHRHKRISSSSIESDDQ